MKLYSLLLLFTVIFCLQTAAQTSESYLISIDISKVSDLNKLEKLALPVYHLFDDVLITKVNNQTIFELAKFKIDFDIIDRILSSSDYYIISRKNKSSTKTFTEYSNVIYSDNESAIIKTPFSIEQLRSEGLTAAQINENLVAFKNEKTINNNVINAVDTTIANIVSKVNPDSVGFFIQSLQNFQTRFLLANTRDAVADWIKSQFVRFGFTDVIIDSFLYQGTWQKNVIATLHGTVMPEKVFVFGGHHDSYSSGNPSVFAPGADDNASGTAAAIEMARVLMESGYKPPSTIKFMTFGAEEYGLWGSRNYADFALNEGIDIKLMINHDMISHTSQSLAQSNVDLNFYTGSEGWGVLAQNIVELYSILTPFYGSINSSGSDSYSFWQKGYKAVYFEERDFSPYYHSPQDIITNYNMPYCAEIIKSSGALLLTAIKMPSEVENYFAFDVGDGSSVQLIWSPNNEPNLVNYKIYIGQSSGSYNQVLSTTDTSFVIKNLTEGNKYYVALSAIDSEGYESFLKERNITPNLVPLVPANFIVEPKPKLIDIKWNKNKELDLDGYNIYRSESRNGQYLKINTDVSTDTFFLDNSAAAGIYYYYFVKAVDAAQNESPSSDTLKSRIISLDRGILLVDETSDGTGSLLDPTDEQVDEFYQHLFSNFNKTNFDIISDGEVTLADLGAYSTVFWQGDDNNNFNSAQAVEQVVKEYLSYGGNFIYSGFRPTRAWQKNTSASAKYKPGMFIYDFLKIDSSINVINSRFIGAIPSESIYSEIFIDFTKTSPTDDYHLKSVESLFPNDEATAIYKFETYFDTTSLQGKLRGRPVGIEYLGADHKSVVLSFPLYYMNLNQAKALLENILVSKFNEVTRIEEHENSFVISSFSLLQNYPNPFNPSTKIRFVIPNEVRNQKDFSSEAPRNDYSLVVLKVYDVLGKEITTLVKDYKSAGSYEVEFNASNLPSGIYFYQLQAGSFVDTKKMLLLR